VTGETTNDATAPYPTELTSDITSGDGTKLHVRAIRPDDASGLIRFHESLSADSVYKRYFFAHPTLSELEVERFTCVDNVDRLALVVEHGEMLVAVARYERTPHTNEAEIAFVIADQYQGHGIGSLLLERLADAARTRGIKRFLAYTLSENTMMLEVFKESGFSLTTTREGETVILRFPIEPDSKYRSSRKAHLARMRDRAPAPGRPQVVTDKTAPVGAGSNNPFDPFATKGFVPVIESSHVD
jgi:GNAT superfamily N-acetyltransferase